MPITTTVITGATSGIGEETAIALAKKDHALYLLVRN
jgi:short-subunit dehydrogenase